MGRELSSEPGSIGPPSAASTVKATTEISAPATGGGSVVRRDSATASRVSTPVTAQTVRPTTSPGDEERAHGTAPVSIIPASSTEPRVSTPSGRIHRRRNAPTSASRASSVPPAARNR